MPSKDKRSVLAKPASFKPSMLNTSKRTNSTSSSAAASSFSSSSSSNIERRVKPAESSAAKPPSKAPAKNGSSRKPAPIATPPSKGVTNTSKVKASASTRAVAKDKGKGKARYIEDEASSADEEEDENEEEEDISDLSVVEDADSGESDEPDDADLYSSDDDDFGADASSSIYGDTKGARGRKRGKKSMPSETQQLKKWRKLSAEEREAVMSEGGIVWREARALISGLPKAAQQLISAALFKALARTDGLLDKALFPREPRMPTIAGTGAGGRTRGSVTSTDAGGEVQSSMISWRVEELGELNNGGLGGDDRGDNEPSGAGFGGDIADLEAMLLPEAEQQVELSRALEEQDAALSKSRARLARIRREAAAAAPSSTTANHAGAHAAEDARANISKLSQIFKAAHHISAQAENDARADA